MLMLDAEYSFALAATIVTHLVDRQRIAPRITVAIAYRDKSQYHLDRTRDYTPSFVAEGGYGSEVQKVSGGGPAFLAVLTDEIIPYLEKRYPASSKDRTLVGHSYGGLFTMYAWIRKPQAFDNCVLVSPSLWYDKGAPLRDAMRACKDDAQASAKRLFLAVGSYEEQPEHDRMMVTDLRALQTVLEGCSTRPTESRIQVFESETHASIFPTALSTALRTLLQ